MACSSTLKPTAFQCLGFIVDMTLIKIRYPV